VIRKTWWWVSAASWSNSLILAVRWSIWQPPMLGGDGVGATVCLDRVGPWIKALCILAS
jgi:hypothetical protein